MGEVVIVGAGPAGISAALYAVRAGASVTVIYMEQSALGKAHKIENYYGVGSVTGEELFEKGIAQGKDLGVKFIKDEVVSIGFMEKLFVATETEKFMADAVILATGSSRKTPKIKGIENYEGKGISYCAVCDGFFFKNKPLGVLGNGKYAVHEAMALKNIASEVTIFTDGLEMEIEPPEGMKINTDKIQEISGEQKLEKVITTQSKEDIEGLFIAQGVAGSAELAKKIGAGTEGSKILINEKMETNIPGLYAIGDCTGGLLQIAKAVYEGATAGLEAIKYIKNK